MITPSSNTCVEPCTYSLLADTPDVTAHFARTPVTRIALDASSEDQFDAAPMVASAHLLADALVSVIAWNGTSGSWLGVDHDRTICAAVTDTTGIPATTSTVAVLDACRVLGVSKIGLVTPYTADVVEAIRVEFARQGIEVVAEQHAGLSDNHAFAATTRTEVESMVRAVAAGAEAVVILCTNVDGTLAAQGLETELAVPVIDSILATAWSAIRMVEPGFRIAGRGALLDHGSLRADLQATIDSLRTTTGGDRSTLRIDLPELGLTVQTAAAESCGVGIRSIRTDTSLPQRALRTVEWLEANRKPLVQNDFHLPPEPPEALREVYGVSAQVLCPVELTDAMTGWISVHSICERTWTPEDIAAIEVAALSVTELIRTH